MLVTESESRSHGLQSVRQVADRVVHEDSLIPAGTNHTTGPCLCLSVCQRCVGSSDGAKPQKEGTGHRLVLRLHVSPCKRPAIRVQNPICSQTDSRTCCKRPSPLGLETRWFDRTRVSRDSRRQREGSEIACESRAKQSPDRQTILLSIPCTDSHASPVCL